MPDNPSGILYLVATPIGNLDDLSARATATLRTVDVIAAEDTRHSRALFIRYGVATPVVSLHEHNEDRASSRLLARLLSGESVAVVSDAGTPLLSDPGLPLVRAARAQGIRVVPVPGPCAIIAALSASGLAVDRFTFEGFPPRFSGQRRHHFETLRNDRRTLIFYESSHRIRETVRDMVEVFGPTRRLVIARELTKVHETIVSTMLGEAGTVLEEPNMIKGEFVLLLEGAPAPDVTGELTADQERILKLLLEECSVKTASSLGARMYGVSRDAFYRRALEIRRQADWARCRGDDPIG